MKINLIVNEINSSIHYKISGSLQCQSLCSLDSKDQYYENN